MNQVIQQSIAAAFCMRPKVAAAILFLAFGVFGIAFFISRAFHHEQGVEVSRDLPLAQTETNISSEKEFSAPAPPTVANDKPTATVSSVIQETNHADYVRDRVAELMALAMNDDSNSLNMIWSELSNQDKEIRAGALDAVVQFGDRSVTNRLRELAARTEDPDEKANILAAVDHLDLPPLGELRRAQQTNGPQ